MSPGPIPKNVEASPTLAHIMTPRCTMSITRTKGLLNMPGQNNCFLNSAVQVLWHLDIFRRSFRDLKGHVCMKESCIFCALKELFAQFQYSQESALPPDALRRALAETFFDQRRFQLGFMDDAAECFENILQRIHYHIASQEAEDMCNVGHCVPHQKFAMTLVEQTVCHVCGGTSEPLPFTQMVHYVSASALCSQAALMQSHKKSVSFGELLWRAGGMGDIRDCPSSCGAKIQICRTLMNRPDIVSLGMVWDSERPTVDHIVNVLDVIGMTIKLQEMFHSVVDSRWASTVTHHLVGIVTYYGKHYSTFFFHTKLRVWIYFDDATVREIGPHWQQVVEKCRRGHFQPLLLLYANPNGTPVCTSSAPSTIVTSPTVVNGKQDNYLNKFKSEVQNNGTHQVPPSQLPNSLLTDERQQWIQNRWQKDGNIPNHSNSNINHHQNVMSAGPKNPNSYYPHHPHAHHMIHRNEGFVSDSSVDHQPSYKPGMNGNQMTHNSETDPNRNITSDLLRRDEIDANVNDTYISRQAVESVLNLQRLQRQRSLNGLPGLGTGPGSRNSSSSLESFENSLQLRDKLSDDAFTTKSEGVDILPSSPRRRDSGNWSGDRNSASSASSSSLDNPYFYILGNKRSSNMARTAGTFPRHEYMNVVFADQGYDSYSLSSTDSFPSVTPGSPAKLDPRLGQIPENMHANLRSEPNLQKTLKDALLEELVINRKVKENSEDCDKLCTEADMLLKKSQEKEREGDLALSVFLCDTAAAKARAAMDAPYSNPQSLVSAKMKHSTCVMRSSNLHKKLKEVEQEERRRQKEANGEISHSRQGSRDSTHSRHSHKESHHSRQNSKDGSSKPSIENMERPSKNIEIYATLPKKGSKKKVYALLSQMSVRVKDDVDVYNDFLVKQRQNSKGDIKQSLSSSKCLSEPETPCSRSRSSKDSSERSLSKLAGMFSKQNDVKESDFSDYSSEWEQTKKTALHRTLSNPAGMKNPDLDLKDGNISSASMKKQHKIRRKLMGGFMRRKNRSLPDLRESQDSPQTESRALDDTDFFQSLRGSPKKFACEAKEDIILPETKVYSVSRGFHQPHRAFVSRDLSHRPLLTKVDPPQVDVSNAVPSVHKEMYPHQLQNTDPKGNIHNLQSKCQPDMQYASNGYGEYSANSNPPATNRTYHSRSVPCIPQTKEMCHVVINNSEEQSVIPPETPPPAAQPGNFFLAEIQAKRQQILKSTTKEMVTQNNGSASAVKEQGAKEDPWLQELQSKQMMMILKKQDLKTRDKVADVETREDCSMKRLSLDSREVVPRAGSPVKHKQQNVDVDTPNNPFQTRVNHPPPNDQHPPEGNESDATSPRSVKALASRFEKILKPVSSEQDLSGENILPPKSSKDMSCNESCDNKQIIQKDLPSSLPPHQQNNHNHLNHPSMYSPPTQPMHGMSPHYSYSSPPSYQKIPYAPHKDSTDSKCLQPNILAPTAVQHDHFSCDPGQLQAQKNLQILYSGGVPENGFSPTFSEVRTFVAIRIPQQCAQASPPVTLSKDTHISLPVPSGDEDSKRPNKPPDYETALQRLEMIRERQRTISPEVFQMSETVQNQASSQPSTSTTELQKKRRVGQKKCVTFSDQVVLVACAEEEDNEYIPNPLLERVYRQHAEQKTDTDDIGSEDPTSPEDTVDGSECSSLPLAKAPTNNYSAGDKTPCHLCHKKFVLTPTVYCPDCAFYMSRFQRRT